MMRKQALQYAIVRFQPHLETEEFANVGVVIVAPESGYLDFRIETRRISRLTAFFDTLDAQFVRKVLQSSKAELERIRLLAGYDHDGQARLDLVSRERAENLFSTLTKDREGIIRYSDVRYAMHQKPNDMLTDLFDHYVSRSFVDVDYKERLLEKHVRQILGEQRFGMTFQSKTYTNGLHRAKFPFVGVRGGEDKIVLKPLFLGQSDPMQIFDHANKWLFRVTSLREQLPKNVTFAVEGPSVAGPTIDAFEEVSAQFTRNGIQVLRPEASQFRNVVEHLQ